MGKEESGLRKILIVEDDKVLNKTLAYNLTADGYEVTSAYSFQDAVERLKKSEFDIALLDINLPDNVPIFLEKSSSSNPRPFNTPTTSLRQA